MALVCELPSVINEINNKNELINYGETWRKLHAKAPTPLHSNVQDTSDRERGVDKSSKRSVSNGILRAKIESRPTQPISRSSEPNLGFNSSRSLVQDNYDDVVTPAMDIRTTGSITTVPEIKRSKSKRADLTRTYSSTTSSDSTLDPSYLPKIIAKRHKKRPDLLTRTPNRYHPPINHVSLPSIQPVSQPNKTAPTTFTQGRTQDNTEEKISVHLKTKMGDSKSDSAENVSTQSSGMFHISHPVAAAAPQNQYIPTKMVQKSNNPSQLSGAKLRDEQELKLLEQQRNAAKSQRQETLENQQLLLLKQLQILQDQQHQLLQQFQQLQVNYLNEFQTPMQLPKTSPLPTLPPLVLPSSISTTLPHIVIGQTDSSYSQPDPVPSIAYPILRAHHSPLPSKTLPTRRIVENHPSPSTSSNPSRTSSPKVHLLKNPSSTGVSSKPFDRPASSPKASKTLSKPEESDNMDEFSDSSSSSYDEEEADDTESEYTDQDSASVDTNPSAMPPKNQSESNKSQNKKDKVATVDLSNKQVQQHLIQQHRYYDQQLQQLAQQSQLIQHQQHQIVQLQQQGQQLTHHQINHHQQLSLQQRTIQQQIPLIQQLQLFIALQVQGQPLSQTQVLQQQQIAQQLATIQQQHAAQQQFIQQQQQLAQQQMLAQQQQYTMRTRNVFFQPHGEGPIPIAKESNFANTPKESGLSRLFAIVEVYVFIPGRKKPLTLRVPQTTNFGQLVAIAIKTRNSTPKIPPHRKLEDSIDAYHVRLATRNGTPDERYPGILNKRNGTIESWLRFPFILVENPEYKATAAVAPEEKKVHLTVFLPSGSYNVLLVDANTKMKKVLQMICAKRQLTAANFMLMVEQVSYESDSQSEEPGELEWQSISGSVRVGDLESTAVTLVQKTGVQSLQGEEAWYTGFGSQQKTYSHIMFLKKKNLSSSSKEKSASLDIDAESITVNIIRKKRNPKSFKVPFENIVSVAQSESKPTQFQIECNDHRTFVFEAPNTVMTKEIIFRIQFLIDMENEARAMAMANPIPT